MRSNFTNWTFCIKSPLSDGLLLQYIVVWQAIRFINWFTVTDADGEQTKYRDGVRPS